MPSREEVIAQLTKAGPFEVVTEIPDGQPMRLYKNAPPNMRAVLLATRVHDPKTFLIYEGEVITFKEHFERVAALAHFLRDHGVKKGDRVAVGMRNYPEWMVAFWACQSIGAVVVALNAWWTGPEIAYALEDSTPAALIIDGERLERLRSLLAKIDARVVIVTRRGGAGDEGVDFAKAVAKATDVLPDEEIAPDDYATILYTSGTTGKPKGAVATHRNHVTNILNTLLGGAVARGLLGDFGPPPTDAPQPAVLQTFPYFHIGGMTGLYMSAVMGAKVALMYKWNPAEAVDLIEKHKITSVSGVPIVVRQLLEAARASGKDVSSLMGIAAGGASVPPDLIRGIEKQFDQKTMPGNGYGLTETTSAVITNGGMEYFARPDSIGKPTPTTEVRIVDDQGNDVPQGEIGEIWMRGPNVIPGYWKNPQATETAFGGGWFRSGDLGYRDTEGFHYVVDRKKDVIIRGGENVYCAEVEAAILENPQVKDVAVVGLPDPEYGEQVAAVIQVADVGKAAALPDELRTSLAMSLAKFKIPSSYKLTTEELPRTATGKVLKRELRELFKSKL